MQEQKYIHWWHSAQYTDDQPAVLFLVAGVFVSGGRDGSIMVWDTRCSTKGNLVQIYNHIILLICICFMLVMSGKVWSL